MSTVDCETLALETTRPTPPSRFGNPFATCWTRPGALAFRFPPGDTATGVVARLAANGWRGAILGPHGAGKSTLLAHLRPLLVASGKNVSHLTLRDRQRRLPRGWLRTALSAASSVVIVDGYEQLSLASRAVLQWRCRRAGAGLIVASHAATCLPALIELQPTRALVDQLVADLTARVPSPMTADDVAACVAGHGSNVRDVFFALYRRHEEGRRIA